MRLQTRSLLFAALVLSAASSQAQTFTTLLNTGDPSNRLDIAIIGDGYTADGRAQFDLDAAAFVDRALAQPPYSLYKGMINVRSVFVVSSQAGADHSDRNPAYYVETALDAAYNCTGIQRLICVSTTKVNAALAGVLTPTQRDVTIVLVNDPEYGGSGGSIAVSSLNLDSTEIVLHELGHSLGLLTDEYTDNPPACSLTVEPSAVNATKEIGRDKIKWANWIAENTQTPTPGTTLSLPGLFQGAEYCAAGKYRPTYDSKMRTLGRAFDQINTEQLIKRFYNIVSPIDAVTPAAGPLDMPAGDPLSFTVTSPPVPGYLFTWSLDGIVGSTSTNFTVITNGLPLGVHSVDLTVADPTPLVKTDPNHLLTVTKHWNLKITAPVVKVNPITTINAASLLPGNLSPDSFVAAQGTGLASGAAAAGLVAPTIPYPTNLGGTTVSVKDSAGVERLAALYYVSATQINYVLPTGTASGSATVTITPASGNPSSGLINVVPVAPGLIMFGGTNIAAAVVVRVRNNVQTVENVYTQNSSGALIAAPIDKGPDTDVVALLLYGTGIRNRTSLSNVRLTIGGTPVTLDYAGAQSQYPALDQINVTLPHALIGSGDLVLQLTVDGLPANPVHLTFK